MNDFNILLLVMSTYIVGFKQSSFFLYHVNCFCMVFYIQPVTNILTITVNRKFFALKRIIDNQRNQFLRELIRSVVIGTVCNIRRELISIHICFYQHIRACFTGRIWTVWSIWCCFIEVTTIFFQRTIHLIC